MIAQQPEFMAWLEEDGAWDEPVYMGEKDGFRLMGSQRKDGPLLLWKFCIETGAISVAVQGEHEHQWDA